MAKRKPRQMPLAGFYVSPPILSKELVPPYDKFVLRGSIIYTTG